MARWHRWVAWIGLVLAVGLLSLSAAARNPSIGGLGLLLGALSWMALRSNGE